MLETPARSSPARAPRWPRQGRRLGARLLPYALSAPSLIILVLFVVLPFISIILTSLQPATSVPNGNGNYARLLGSSFYRQVLYNTIETGLLTTVITLVVGYPLALYISFASERARRYVMLAVLSPLFINLVVRAYALSLSLGPGNPVNRISGAGFDILFSEPAVIIGLVYTMVPYMILCLCASMNGIDQRILAAADSLGASFLYTLRRVLLPLSRPGIAAGCVLVCTMSMASFVIPLELGGSGYQVWMWVIYQEILVVADWPTGFAMAVILFVLIVVVLALGQVFLLRSPRGRK